MISSARADGRFLSATRAPRRQRPSHHPLSAHVGGELMSQRHGRVPRGWQVPGPRAAHPQSRTPAGTRSTDSGRDSRLESSRTNQTTKQRPFSLHTHVVVQVTGGRSLTTQPASERLSLSRTAARSRRPGPRRPPRGLPLSSPGPEAGCPEVESDSSRLGVWFFPQRPGGDVSASF